MQSYGLTRRVLSVSILVVACAGVSGVSHAQLVCPNTPPSIGEVLIPQLNLVHVDPNAPPPPGTSPEPAINAGYYSLAHDFLGRLITNRGGDILAVDLEACTETPISSGGSLADAPDMVAVGNVVYATDDSNNVRGVFQVDLVTGVQTLITSSVIPSSTLPNLLGPQGITVNSLGHIFVADPGSGLGGTDGRIVFVNPRVPFDPADPQANQTVIASGFNASLPQPGVVYNLELQDPIGIVWDPATDDLLVTDQGRILRFDQNGILKETISVPLALSVFSDIEIDASGRFLVVGHDVYGTQNILARVTPAGGVEELISGRDLFRPRRLAIVPDSDRDGLANSQDNCPLTPNADQADTDQNGIGDACQCGDVTRDGISNVTDALKIARGEVSVSGPGFPYCDVNGDGVCNVTDALMIARGELSSSPWTQLCPAYAGVF